MAEADWFGLRAGAVVWLGGVYFGGVAGGLGGGAVWHRAVGLFDAGVATGAWSDAAAAGGACVAESGGDGAGGIIGLYGVVKAA